ncbi:MAG TPA: polysaccharide biosynthesis/export family protein [Acidobacteriaceae bacterium]
MHKTRLILTFALLQLILVSNSVGQNGPVVLKSTLPFQVSDTPQDVIVGSGDLLAVSVAGAPEYRYDVRVGSSGYASLPMVGNIKVAGLSTLQAESTIAQNLEKRGFFNDPQVSVFVKEYATQGISILGEVQKPGIYPLLGHRTLLDAISAAGGTTPKAGKSVSITHRDQPDGPETVMLSQDNGRTMNNRTVQPGDTIEVSKAGMVYVVGDVKEPTGIILDNPHLTVLQAIAMAHGTNSTASLKSAKLIRKATRSPEEIPIPLDTILAAKSPDLELQPDDIVFVPNSLAKSATRRGLEAILQTATGIAVYGRY